MLPNRGALWTVLGMAALAVACPSPAVAQDGVLYEVSENMKIRSGKVTRRVAAATLVGTVNAGTPWCPAALGVVRCDITAIGSDSVDLRTGRGPLEASFAIVVQGDNPADGPELVISRGTLRGLIDLSPAVVGPDGLPGTDDELPYGSMTGTWTVRGERSGPLAGYQERGRLTGTFRLPVAFGGYPPMYMTDWGMAPVADAEHSLAVPTVRLEIVFQP
jgi:hypothetical protein